MRLNAHVHGSEKMAVTMKQLAADVGVSVVTISKVLHNNPDISKKTRDRVMLLRLPVERLMVGILRHQHKSQQSGAGETSINRP